ncbi:hypothetical protein ACP70R_045782 [Stipagrostis hirtigluma subsp. patula]
MAAVGRLVSWRHVRLRARRAACGEGRAHRDPRTTPRFVSPPWALASGAA